MHAQISSKFYRVLQILEPTCAISSKCSRFKDIKYDILLCHEGHEGHEGHEQDILHLRTYCILGHITFTFTFTFTLKFTCTFTFTCKCKILM